MTFNLEIYYYIHNHHLFKIVKIWCNSRYRSPQHPPRPCTLTSLSWNTRASTTPANTLMETTGGIKRNKKITLTKTINNKQEHNGLFGTKRRNTWILRTLRQIRHYLLQFYKTITALWLVRSESHNCFSTLICPHNKTLSDCRVVIRAAINIKKGEHISINYSDPMWGSANRQLHLGKWKRKKKIISLSTKRSWV